MEDDRGGADTEETDQGGRDQEAHHPPQADVEVLADDGAGLAAEGHHDGGESGEIIAHQGDVGGFEGDIGASGPIAMPTVACASAGASLTPSPTMATLPSS